MMRTIGRTGVGTMARAALTAVLTVGVGTTASAAGPGEGDAPVARPLAAAALATGAGDPATGTADGEQDPAPNPVIEFLKKIEVDGMVEGYYMWAFNEENLQLHAFDVLHNDFALGYVELGIGKPVSEDSRGGFRVDFSAGETAELTHIFEPGGPDYMKHVQQAYVSYLAPVGSGLTVDFGKFVTPAGAEVIESKDNYNYSRGLLFSLAIPLYHAGFRVGYTLNDQWSVKGFLVNGWNNVRENNDAKTVGVSLGYTPTDKTTIGINYLVGDEFADEDDGGTRSVVDLVATYAATDRMSVLANFDYGRDSLDGDDLNWYGVALGLKYQVNDRWAVSPRYEWFVDDDGFATGLSQTLQEVTLTAEYKAIGGLLTRFEVRSDFSDEDFFANGDELKSTQPTASVSFVYAFSSK